MKLAEDVRDSYVNSDRMEILNQVAEMCEQSFIFPLLLWGSLPLDHTKAGIERLDKFELAVYRANVLQGDRDPMKFLKNLAPDIHLSEGKICFSVTAGLQFGDRPQITMPVELSVINPRDPELWPFLDGPDTCLIGREFYFMPNNLELYRAWYKRQEKSESNILGHPVSSRWGYNKRRASEETSVVS